MSDLGFGRGVLLPDCFRTSTLSRTTRACDGLGGSAAADSRRCVCVRRELVFDGCESDLAALRLVTGFCWSAFFGFASLATCLFAEIEDDREIDSASAAAVTDSDVVGVLGLAAGEGCETAIAFSAELSDLTAVLLFISCETRLRRSCESDSLNRGTVCWVTSRLRVCGETVGVFCGTGIGCSAEVTCVCRR